MKGNTLSEKHVRDAEHVQQVHIVGAFHHGMRSNRNSVLNDYMEQSPS
jgi:hypothetical protein